MLSSTRKPILTSSMLRLHLRALLFIGATSVVMSCTGGAAQEKGPPLRQGRTPWLMNTSIDTAPQKDLVKHFGYSRVGELPEESGLKDHIFVNTQHVDSMGTLFLSTDKQGRIVHMMLVLPRTLFDSPKNVVGRDLVKSFICASGNEVDDSYLQKLAEEVYFRDLDLHPMTIDAHYLPGTEKPKGQPYKLGSGETKSGDPVVWADKIPVLSNQPTEGFLVVMGKISAHGYIFKNCRLGFSNNVVDGKSVLRCEAWDEQTFATRESPKN